ncbi:MAG: MBL fold metallo-hydrolase [Acidimicrobiia bacterium]
MKLTLWGTRGSLATGGPDTARYGGDTASIEVRTESGELLILDAGSGIRPIGSRLGDLDRVDILLSHLHMDHISGLPFFSPMLDPDVEVHLWGPISTTESLRERLGRYLSPPQVPVRIRDLPRVEFHDVSPGSFDLGGIEVTVDLISHPGPTLGLRLTESGSTLAYMPDHEPALGGLGMMTTPEWVSGYELAHGADVLIHDAQYTEEEYGERVGWGHTSFNQLIDFARLTEIGRLITFHHDPSHSDVMLDEVHAELTGIAPDLSITAGKIGTMIEV